MVLERSVPIERLARGEVAQFLAQSAARVRLGAITQRFIEGEISEYQWGRLMQTEIREAATTSFLVGYERQSGQLIGRLADLPGPAQRAAVDYVNQQIRFFTQWRNQLLERAGFNASRISAILTARDGFRAELYGAASDGAFNKGKRFAALDGGQDVLIFWRLRPAEHCISCLALHDASPFTPEALPTEPGAGDTECRSNCQCFLEFVPKLEVA